MGKERGSRTRSSTRSPRSDTYDRIYRTVRRIPRGRVATYGQVAAVSGLARQPRLIGYALHNLPEASAVPWQRVVNARGAIALVGGGSDIQRRLLEAEGVEFDRRGRVDLERFLWQPGARRSRSSPVRPPKARPRPGARDGRRGVRSGRSREGAP